MKQTEHYGLSLMEAADLLSAKPLNENAEKIDAALAAHAETIAEKLMMATGSYTGDGTRSVTIQTPGFKPQAVLMRKPSGINANDYSQIAVFGGWCLWLGADMSAGYEWLVRDEEDASFREETVETTVEFISTVGSLSWSIPDRRAEYAQVMMDQGPNVVNNATGSTYQWIAFGVAE